jgi:antitoxin CptB
VNELAKLRWQCRRGMKELDLLLENYLATDYLLADDEQKKRFADLLTLEDDELLTALIKVLTSNTTNTTE